VQDILIASVDGLSGFVEAINVAYPKTEVQRCIIHQIRSSTRYVSYKDIKQFTADLKPVYKAPTEESARSALNEFEVKWGTKYPLTSESYQGKERLCF
jgi:transposase-like protein